MKAKLNKKKMCKTFVEAIAEKRRLKPVGSTVKLLRGIQTEITAGSVLLPRDEADMAHNNANKRAVEIIDQYIAGKGLFQE